MKKLVIVVLFFLSGCNFAPPYERPPTCPTANWRVNTNETTTLANLRFWESFDDPVLNALILEALSYNRDLNAAAWNVIQYYGQFLEVRSNLFPQITADASAFRERFSYVAVPPALKQNITPLYEYEFLFSWEIDLWGQLRNATDAAFEQLLAQVENRRTVVLTLVSSVAQGYFTLRELDRQLEIAYNTLEVRREAMRIAWERWQGGLTSQIDYTQSIALFDQAQAAVVILEKEIPIQENLLSVLVGETPTCVTRGKTIDKFPTPPCVPAGLPSELLERRPDILAAEHLLLASNAEIGVAKAAFFPQLTLTGLFGGESFQLNKLFSQPARTWQIGGTIFQPLFTGGFLTGQLIEAIAQNKEAYYTYQQTVLNAFKEVNDALISQEQAKKLVLVENDRVKDLELYLQLAWERYYEGQTDYLTVLNASQELFNAQLDLASAQGNVLITLVDIYKAVGGGWVLDADECLRGTCEEVPEIVSPIY